MTLKYICTILLLCSVTFIVHGQTLSQAKALYDNGEYEQALPLFKKLVSASPRNGQYNLYYGVCCLQTNRAEEAVPYLETAVRRRVTSGQLYLGQAYHATYRFDEAIDVYEDYITELKRRKRPTQTAEALLKKSQMGARLIKGVECVEVIDSIVIDKADFLSAYNISPESGRLFMYNAYFQNAGTKQVESTVYQTQMKNKLYYAIPSSEGFMHLCMSNRTEDGWSRPIFLSGIGNDSVNTNYPYVMTDGITLYYAADGDESLGGYDIFVTRYNMSNDSYLTSQNIGMPFNSPYNDYLYVIDEYNELGWFVSDRHQPQDKVCIYIFIPNMSKEIYDFDTTPSDLMRGLARLNAIRETWTHPELINQALIRLKQVRTAKPIVKKDYDFTFIIDDTHIYHKTEDFCSKDALNSFDQYQTLQNTYHQTQDKLLELRQVYAKADLNERNRIAPAILDLEKRSSQLHTDLQKLAKRIRQQEKLVEQ